MCEICMRLICPPRCPNYKEEFKCEHICCVCEESIYPGEKFIRNVNNQYIHCDCIEGVAWLLDWLDYEVEEI